MPPPRWHQKIHRQIFQKPTSATFFRSPATYRKSPSCSFCNRRIFLCRLHSHRRQIFSETDFRSFFRPTAAHARTPIFAL